MKTATTTPTGVDFTTTADGHPAARVAHLIVALVPGPDGSRTLVRLGDEPTPYSEIVASGGWADRRREVRIADCVAADFHVGGFRATDEASFRAEVEEYALHHRQMDAMGRRPLPTRPGFSTADWGAVQTGSVRAAGVMEASTAEHGGFVLTREANELVDPRWRSPLQINHAAALAADPDDEDGRIACYEEDELWAIVAFTLPHLFSDRDRRFADESLSRSHPALWQELSAARAPAVLAAAA